jgi:hypothetical protein
MPTLRRLLGLAVMFFAGLGQAAAAETPPGVEYLYVESNEGGSSGGHVALRVGDDVFHFEHRPPGILVLGRDDFEHFRYRYSVLENRTIHASRIAMTGETAGLLADRFRRRHFLQRRHLDVIESLRADRTTLEEMLSGGLLIEAAGYFFSDQGRGAEPAPIIEDPDLADLRARVALAHGADFLERRMGSLRAVLAELDPLVMDLPELPTGEMPPAPAYSFPQRYRDLMEALASLQVLRDARPLVRGALRESASDDLAFTETDSLAARRLSDDLAAALVRLVASDRPDGGVALMVGMARLAALGASRRQERWVILDFFPSETMPAPRRRLAVRPEEAAVFLEDARVELARTRERLVSRSENGSFPEAAFAAFEAAANRADELRLALAEERERRALKMPLVPSRPARLSVTGLDHQALRQGLEAVHEREEAYAVGFKRRWGYNLVTRNCVSEVFSEIDAAFEGGAGEAERRMGGRVRMDGSFNFIPAVSAAAVETSYPVTERLQLTSYRRALVEEMYRQENPVTVFLRESNTLTSAIYRRNANDSIFVFFTDDAVVARPLFGAVNLVVGIAASAVGLVALPVDGGATLWAGLKGALFSLPELFFQNIRKGSFEHVRREDLPEPVTRRAEAPSGG